MKRISLLFFIVLGIIACSSKEDQKIDKILEKDIALTNKADSLSYSLGVVFGVNIAGFETDFNLAALLKGLSESIDTVETKLSPNEANQYIQDHLNLLRNKELFKNLDEGRAFLEENKKKDGIVETESGLQYQVLTEGSGEKPQDGDMVKVHYHGTLIDGTVFDSSVDRGEPIDLSVNGVIPGWTEALKMMPIGAKWRLFIPTELAYGQNPRPGGVIQPNMALIFEVELIEIVK